MDDVEAATVPHVVRRVVVGYLWQPRRCRVSATGLARGAWAGFSGAEVVGPTRTLALCGGCFRRQVRRPGIPGLPCHHVAGLRGLRVRLLAGTGAERSPGMVWGDGAAVATFTATTGRP